MPGNPFTNALTRRLGGFQQYRQLNDLALAAGVRRPGEPLSQIHVFELQQMEDDHWQRALESHRQAGRMLMPLTFDGMQRVKEIVGQIKVDERYIPRPVAERR